MPAELFLSFEVEGFRPERARIVREAFAAFVAKETEGFVEDNDCEEWGVEVQDDGSLLADAPDAVKIARSHVYLPALEKRLRACVDKANGAPCNVKVKGRDNEDEEE